MRFHVLGSSSSGNCALVVTPEAKVLIDAGFSGRRISQFLAQLNLTIEDLDAVFFTHEHTDHATGAKGLSKYPHLQCFANYGTAQAIQRGLNRQLSWKLFETGRRFAFRDLEIQTWGVPHDAYDPVSFVFSTGDGSLFQPFQSIGWVTDLGHVPDGLEPLIRRCQGLVIESNHDLEMLENEPKRPWAVKQRIRGRHGHLSNEDTLHFLQSAHAACWRKVLFAHISRDCNSIARVAEVHSVLEGRFETQIIDPETFLPVSLDLSSL